MKAAQFTAFTAPLQIVNLPTPEPTKGGVLINVRAAGLCRSDWHAWQGHDSDIKSLPHVLGHEFSGTIAALGEGVTDWKIGDRVTTPFACGCGDCRECSTGNTQVCESQYQPGVTGPGAFAETVALPFAQTNLVHLPDKISFAAAASLGCRFATAYRALAHKDQANLQPGERLAVFGCGGVGLSAIMIGKALRAKVVAIDIRDSALELAQALGADEVMHFDQVKNLDAEVTIDALGKTATCEAAINSLLPRGRHVQIGLMLADDAHPPLPVGTVIAKELKIIGSHGMGAAAYPEMLELVASRKLEPEKLVADIISLSEVPAAIQKMGSFETAPGVTLIQPTA